MSHKPTPPASWALLLFSIVILGGCGAGSGRDRGLPQREPAQGFSLEEVQKDFRQMQRIIERRHPKLNVQPERLSELFDSRFRLLSEGMDELAFYRVLTPIVEALGCGHTALRVSRESEAHLRSSARYFPFEVRVRNDRIYVFRDLSAARIPQGAEILSINGRSAGEVVSVLLGNITAEGDNLTRKYHVMNNGFGGAYLHYVEVTDSYDIVYRESTGGRSLSLTVSGVRDPTLTMSEIGFFNAGEEPGVGYRSDFGQDYAVLTIRSFGAARGKSYEHFLEEFFRQLRERRVSTLILDLRGNWGGPPGPAMLLYSYLIREPSRYFGGRLPFYFFFLKRPVEPAEHGFHGKLYTLIDGACFSTTGHLISLLEHHELAAFIGEESGSSWICTDASHDFTLGKTGIRLHCATRIFQTAVSGQPKGRGLLPHYEVIPSLQDQLAARDTVMERAVELAGQR